MRKRMAMTSQGPDHRGARTPLLLITVAFAGLLLAPGAASAIERLRIKPGFNLFTPDKDVQLGRDAAKDVDKQLPLVTDPEVVRYVNDLGRKLKSYAPYDNSSYAWEFKVVNSREINAFALPGGYIYVNRGALEAADDEAEIAGVMAHESGHVVMRHGTHLASQAILAQAPLAILGGMLGDSGSLTGQLAQMGISFGVNSLFLKNSRSAEAQADEVGTYILYQAGYDPHAMAQFFQIIQKKYPQQTLQFFSDHPNPENRIKAVDAEIPRLGPAKEWITNNPQFDTVKKRLLSLPPPPKPKAGPGASTLSPNPPLPSARMLRFQGTSFTINYPENWKAETSEDSVALAPPGGVGEEGQAFGASISFYRPTLRGNWGLVDATQQLLDSMRQSNPNLRVVRQGGMNLQGRPAITTVLENDSPLEGQKESDRLVTVRSTDSLLAVVFIVPSSSQEAYAPTFDSMLQSLQLQ